VNETKIHITPAGAAALRDELNYLWRVKRPDVTQKVSDAAALGDRSENADYIYGKKQLREIDSRIRFLTKRLENLEIVDRTPTDESKVYFGAWVKLENESGKESVLRIVGADEYDPTRGWISINSPMAKALLGKQKEQDIVIRLPAGDQEYYIVDVRYRPFDEGSD